MRGLVHLYAILALVEWGVVLAYAFIPKFRGWQKYWIKRLTSSQIRKACAAAKDCRIAICFEDDDLVMIACETHGTVRIESDPRIVSRYQEMARAREGGEQ